MRGGVTCLLRHSLPALPIASSEIVAGLEVLVGPYYPSPLQRGLLQPPTSSVPHIRVYHILRRWCQAVRDVKTYGRVHSVPYEHRYPLYHQRDGLDRICENV